MTFLEHLQNFREFPPGILGTVDSRVALHPSPSYSVIAADTLCDLDLCQWSYMAGHMFNPSTKFEDPTAIRSLELCSDISRIGYH